MLYPRKSSRYASRSILGNSASILFVFMLLGYQAFMGYQALIHILGAEAFALYPGKWKLHALSWDIRFLGIGCPICQTYQTNGIRRGDPQGN